MKGSFNKNNSARYRWHEQIIHIIRIMGLFKSQKKMVAWPYYLFPAGDRINAGYGGRLGGGAFYLYIILIFKKEKV
jgi:hypothetical protein